MKLRIRFSKLGKVRWISHRDVARAWERAFRRVGLPLAYSAGFAPRPKVSFGLALPTGAESVAEYLDVHLAGEPEGGLGGLAPGLSSALPAGVDVLAVAALVPPVASLQQDVTACTWRIEVAGASAAEVRDAVGRVLAAETLVVTRERKGQPVTDDLRPAIADLAVLGLTAGGVALEAELGTRTRGVRPAELASALGDGVQLVRVWRLHQWIERDGARREVLPLATTDAPHAWARAS